MQVVLSKPEVVVIDDFLESPSFEFVWSYIQSEEFEHVHRMGWVNAWRLSDGIPLRGPVTLSHSTDADRFSQVHPTGKGIDLVIRKILEIQNQLADWIGIHTIDWSHFFCRPYIYNANTGLSWHRDNENCTTGAFTFYCHRNWNVQWGGELLVAGIESKRVQFPKSQFFDKTSTFLGTHLDNTSENNYLLAAGSGRYILPKPNRLVVVPAGVLHGIKKVDSAAGSHVRASLQGTFMFPEKESQNRG